MAVDGGEDTEEDVVPTVFRWEHGGRQVYIQGTFNNWERQIPMHRSGNDFTYIHNLKRGKHAFKFIVDDEWRCVRAMHAWLTNTALYIELTLIMCPLIFVDLPCHA